MWQEQQGSVLLFLLISACSAAPTVRTPLEVKSPALHNYWREAQGCRQFVHHRFDKDDEDFHILASSTHDMSVPLMLSSTHWPADQAKRIWDERAHCVFHVLIINASPGMTYKLVIETFRSFKVLPEFEYYFAVSKCHSCITSSYDWMDSQFGIRQRDEVLFEIYRGQSFRPFMVVIEYRFGTREIEHVHNFWLHCEYSFFCVRPDNMFGIATSADKTREETIRSYLMADSFPQSVSQQMMDYKEWPMYLEFALGHRVTFSDITDTTRTAYRNFFGYQGPWTLSPVVKVALEVASYLNATLEEYYDDPVTVISMTVSSNFRDFSNVATIATTTLNFMYCLKDELADSANILLIFKPFDRWVWFLLLMSVILLLIILNRMVGHFSCFRVLRCLLEPDKIPGGKCLFLFLLWTSSCALLGTLYACFIQSLLVVPAQYRPLTSFQELAQAGYRIVFPKNTNWNIGLHGEHENQNWFGLDSTLDEVESKTNKPAFWEHFLRNEKRAFVTFGRTIHLLTEDMDALLNEERCFEGEKRSPWLYDWWVSKHLNSAYVQLLFQKLNSAGILQLYHAAVTRRHSRIYVNKYLKAIKNATSALKKPSDTTLSRESSDISLKIENMKMVLGYFGIGILISFTAHAAHYLWRLFFHLVTLYYYLSTILLL